jgi:hypothetical protein
MQRGVGMQWGVWGCFARLPRAPLLRRYTVQGVRPDFRNLNRNLASTAPGGACRFGITYFVCIKQAAQSVFLVAASVFGSASVP